MDFLTASQAISDAKADRFYYISNGTKNQGLVSKKECPNAQLKEIKEGERRSGLRIVRMEAHFLRSEAVISLNKDIKDSLKILQFPREALVAPCQWILPKPTRTISASYTPTCGAESTDWWRWIYWNSIWILSATHCFCSAEEGVSELRRITWKTTASFTYQWLELDGFQ